MRIGKYEVQEELGRGGFGRVYRAYDPDVGRPVAIKLLTAEDDEDLRARFRSEAATTARLQHKNIVTVHDYGEHEGKPFLVMELLQGENLQQVIESKRPISLLDKVRIMTEIAEGLECAHRSNVVHRDVKPANMMILPNGTVKIMDFGIARVTGSNATRRTQQGYLLGTIHCMAPEQFASGAPADVLVDIFAYGGMYYEILTGFHPFQANDVGAVMYKITSTEPKPLRQIVPSCPEILEIVVHRALAKDRDMRYQSLQDLLFDTEPLLGELRQQRAAEMLVEVRVQVSGGHLDTAQTKLREVLETDPSNREAQQLRRSIQEQAQKQQIQHKVEELVRDGQRQLEERQFSEAIQTFERALRLDKSAVHVRALLDQSTAALESHKKATRLVSEARREMQQGNLTAAHDKLSLALAADVHHREASLLQDNLRREFERRREQRLQEALQRAGECRGKGDYDGALQVLAQIEAEQPGAPAVAQLRAEIEQDRARAEARRKAERYRAGLERIRAALRAGELDEAGRQVEAIRAEFPAESEREGQLAELRRQLEQQRRTIAVGEITRQAQGFLQGHRFAEARETVADGLRQFPGDSGLSSLEAEITAAQTAYERARGLEQAVSQSQQLRRKGQLDEATKTLAAARQQWGEDPALTAEQHHVEEELRQRQYAADVHTALEQARALLAAQRAAEAVTALENSTSRFPAEKELATLLEEARQLRAHQEEQEFVRRALAAAEQEGQRFAGAALLALDQALQRYPNHPQLRAAADRWRIKAQDEERAERRAWHLAQIRQAMGVQDWPAAIHAAQAGLEEFPHDAELERCLTSAHESHRRSQVDQLATQVHQSFAQQDLGRAAHHLNETQHFLAHDEVWRSLQQELRYREEYQRQLDEAGRLRAQGHLLQAEELLRHVLAARQGPDRRAEELLHAIQAEREQLERQAAIAAGRRQIEQLRTAGDLLAALAVVDNLLHHYPHDTGLKAEQRSLTAQIEEQRREAERLERERQAALREEEKRRAAEAERQRKEKAAAEKREKERLEAERKAALEAERERAAEEERRRKQQAAAEKREQERLEAERRAAAEAERKTAAEAERRRVAEEKQRREDEQRAAAAAAAARRQEEEQRAAATAAAATRQREEEQRRRTPVEPQRSMAAIAGTHAVVSAPVDQPVSVTVPLYRRPAVLGVTVVVLLAAGYWGLSGSTVTPVHLVPTPSRLSFDAKDKSLAPQEISWPHTPATFEATSDVPWLMVTPARGERVDKLTVSVQPQGLTPGTHTASIKLASKDEKTADGPVVIPVEVVVPTPDESASGTITPPPPPAARLHVAPASLDFRYRDGQAMPAPRQITVSAADFRATAHPVSEPGAHWLQAVPSGKAIRVSVQPQGLTVGTHTGYVAVESGGESQRVAVSLTIEKEMISVSGSGVAETLRWRGSLDPGQTLTIQGGQASPPELEAGELPKAGNITILDTSASVQVVTRPTARNGFKLEVRNSTNQALRSVTIHYRVQ